MNKALAGILRIKEFIRSLQGRSKHAPEPAHAKNPSATKKGPGRYHKQGGTK